MENTQNQQAILTIDDALEIGYIAGAVDGEGSLGFQKCYTKCLANERYSVRIRICNTDKSFCARLYFSLKRLGFPAHFEEVGQRYSKTKRPYKRSYTVGIYGFKRCKHFLQFFEAHLTVKWKQAHFMRNFIDSRETKKTHDIYDDYELGLIQKVRDLNQYDKGPVKRSSETNEQNNVMSVEDRVQTSK
jgi:hypothetical protein